MPGPRPFAVVQVSVGVRRIEAVVRVADDRFMRTSAVDGIAEELLALMPGLRRHRCECGSARGIAAELSDTEMPHLLEHVTLEIAALAGSPRWLSGETRWDFSADGHGVFRVFLDYDDDLVLLAALREAVTLVEEIVCRQEGARAAGATIGPAGLAEAVERVSRMRSEGAPTV